GFLIPLESNEKLNTKIKTGDELEINLNQNMLKNISDKTEYELKPLGSVFEIVESGGLFNYARKNQMI
ncbi:MAG: 3-isopropylmalate dehydratase, partial [Candidatus Omnitrophica bacterium]|nr:3-isopropylmalate dehydratase [Candidatus Omnitrophota bacterium]